MEFKQPPILTNQRGEIRKAGFELEFGNLTLETVADAILQLYGGKLQVVHRYNQKVVDTEMGDFTLKIDLALLSEKEYHRLFDSLGIPIDEIQAGKRSLDTLIEGALETVARVSIPNELSFPPLPFDQVHRAEELRQALHDKKAEGTKASIFYAFAMHINPELPSQDVDTVLTYTRAFLLLYPWLLKSCQVDFTRRLTTFINPFPAAYYQLILPSDYQPNLQQFIRDYHLHNPDRNRPLDLYPVLAFMAPSEVNQLKNLGNVKPRPTFHYRLPNSLIDDPNWNIAAEWNRWYEVERLASEPALIRELSQEYLRMQALPGFEKEWMTNIETWVHGENEKTQDRHYGT
jgi:hypothetical protein